MISSNKTLGTALGVPFDPKTCESATSYVCLQKGIPHFGDRCPRVFPLKASPKWYRASGKHPQTVSAPRCWQRHFSPSSRLTVRSSSTDCRLLKAGRNTFPCGLDMRMCLYYVYIHCYISTYICVPSVHIYIYRHLYMHVCRLSPPN